MKKIFKDYLILWILLGVSAIVGVSYAIAPEDPVQKNLIVADAVEPTESVLSRPIPGTTVEPTVTPTPTPEITIEEDQGFDFVEPEPITHTVYASMKSDVYHESWCRYVDRILPQNLITFDNTEEAEMRGYRPCEICLGGE